jgi:hypothetical protein
METPADDDVYLKKVTTRVSQNLILHKNADQPKAQCKRVSIQRIKDTGTCYKGFMEEET